MEREQELIEQLDAVEKAFEAERQRWQREKEEYQNLCAWYANSLRYQLGGLLIDTLKHPLHLLKLPVEMFRLVQNHKQQQVDVKDIESNIPVNVDLQNEIRSFDFLSIEHTVNQIRESGITIIIPVFNAYDELCKCVDSVISYTTFPYQVLLINDCSTDPRIAPQLSHYASRKNIKVITNSTNLGYVKSINVGIQACATDVLLLNSDTIVTPKWLEKIIIAAYSDHRIMTVTPLSNAAGIFSAPEIDTNNELLPTWNLEDISKIVENLSSHLYERVPTGNGFCMFIKREAFLQVGLFDEEAFQKGYCEENDFCMRLFSKGFDNIICDNTYIFHHHSASFQGEKQKLLQHNKDILLSRYPQYDYLVGKMLCSQNLKQVRHQIRQGFKNYEQTGVTEKNILYVIQYANGGSVKTNEDLMNFIDSQNNWNVFMLNSDCETLRLYQLKNKTLYLLKKWDMNSKWDINSLYNAEWRNIYFNILFHYHIDIVHIRHLYKHTFDIVDAAYWFHIPMVLSFHDFYYICPTTNLINGKGLYCNADCSSANGQCRISEPCIKINDDMHKWIKSNWRNQLTDLFKKTDAFVTTSEYSKELFENVFSNIKGRVLIYEHGRDFSYPRIFYGSLPDKNQKIRIMIAGNIDYNKGANYISQLIDADKNKLLEFHCIGNLPEELKSKVKYYGKYIRDDFKDYVVKIKPSFMGIFSIWPETYCHIITEAFSCGIPCVVSDIGTLRERGLKGGCILADLNDPSETCRKIYTISTNPTAYQQLVNEALSQTIRSVADMGNDYLNLYNSLLRRN